MYPFNLRGQKLRIQHAQLFENSRWDTEPIGEITDEEIIIHGIFLAKRQRDSRAPEPYVLVDEFKSARYPEDALVKPSGRGFWLHQAER